MTIVKFWKQIDYDVSDLSINVVAGGLEMQF